MSDGTDRTTVLIVDDQEIVRRGIKACLAEAGDIDVVGDVGSAESALVVLDALRPDVVLLDISMPGMSGLEALAAFRRRMPATKAIMLSVYDERDFAESAAKAGAMGYLMKECAPEEMIRAVRDVATGKTAYSTRATEALVSAHIRGSRGEHAAVAAPLTPRQREVLALVARGRSSREIAERLGISTRTVEAHRASMMKRLGVRSAAALTRVAIERGLLPPA